MKYFLDTEFIEYPNTVELISIGLVCEDGRTYYAISSEYNFNKASGWVKKNVITPIYTSIVHGDDRNRISVETFHKVYGKPIKQIKSDILTFVNYPEYPTGKPEFWGYYADYDWVVFCWIFGTMADLPEGFPMYCKDLKQWMDQLGLDKLPISEPKDEHNALADAKWNFSLYKKLEKISNNKNAFFLRMMELISEYDIFDMVFWNTDLQFFVICNDEFGPGSDAEPILPTDILSLERYLDSWHDDPSRGCLEWVRMKRMVSPTCVKCKKPIPIHLATELQFGKWLCKDCGG